MKKIIFHIKYFIIILLTINLHCYEYGDHLNSSNDNSINASELPDSTLQNLTDINIQKKKIKINDNEFGELILKQILKSKNKEEKAKIVVIGVHHYETAEGKILGIWPLDYSEENLYELKNKWGFNGIFCRSPQDYLIATNPKVNFNTENIMLSVSFDKNSKSYEDVITKFKARYYYIDETVNHACAGNGNKRLYSDKELITVNNFIKNVNDGSLFISGGYKRCSHFDSLANIVDGIMYTAYSQWTEYGFICPATGMEWGEKTEMTSWWQEGDDQRDAWSSMKNRYSNKFFQTWMNTKEVEEYAQLFSHAKSLDLKNIWIYGYLNSDNTPVPHHSDSFNKLSEAAFKAGYLKKFVKEYIIECNCKSQLDCECDIPYILKTGNYKILPVKNSIYEVE